LGILLLNNTKFIIHTLGEILDESSDFTKWYLTISQDLDIKIVETTDSGDPA